ncbi:retropepsin-like aspartic protease [Costertonia aggregata]|uniref:Clan AA aspartic protease n=1 Tax=Costertonia aggregata TaxID=343403 RepID=A0A7H9APR8_9FLAO|nr:retropepsin-like aspartic protease [Costertonia aggregata]QLG45471.1 clan AA aspartic protease [Costertonia aggregata]
MRKTILFISAIHLFIGCATYKYKKQGFVNNDDYFTEIPFTYKNGFILLPVTIEGETFNFLLDTGAELNLIDPTIAGKLNLKILKKGTISNGKDSQNKIERVEIDKIYIGGIEFEETVAMIWDISKFSKYMSCEKIDGFIGNNLMRKSNWQIDYQKKIIRIADSSNKFEVSENHKKIKINSGTVGNVYLNLKIGEKYKDFTFDTGFNGFAQTGDTTLLKNTPSIKKIGITGANFTGSKKGITYLKMMETFTLNGHRFKSPTYFLIKPENSSVLGNEFFENYTLTIDWTNDYLILDASKEYDLKKLDMYEVGFFPDFEKGMITIANIYEKSDFKDTIKPKSKVLRINNIDLVELAQKDKLCDFWSSGWEGIREKDVLHIVLEQGGKQQTFKIQKITHDW